MSGRLLLPIVLFAALLVAGFVGHAIAESYTVGSLAIGNPWTRATPKGATVAGAYLTISNKGTAPDRLIGGSSAVAGRFEVHSMLTEQGVAKMRPITGGLEIKPSASTAYSISTLPASPNSSLPGSLAPLASGC